MLALSVLKRRMLDRVSGRKKRAKVRDLSSLGSHFFQDMRKATPKHSSFARPLPTALPVLQGSDEKSLNSYRRAEYRRSPRHCNGEIDFA